MRYACIAALALISFCASAQFQDKWHIKFPSGSEPLEVKWANVDLDTALDVVVANRVNGRVSFTSYSDSAFLSVHELVNTGFVSGTFSLCDFNRDNRIDIIMSGIDTLGNHSTELYLWTSPFVYEKQSASLLPFSSSKVVFADLNSDGKDEFVVAGSDGHLSAWKWKGNSAVQLFDSANVVPKDILVYDFDRNGFNDIAVSGTDAGGQPKVLIIEYANAFDTIRTIRFPSAVSGKMDAGDVNHDGVLDLLISGIDTTGNFVTKVFLNQTSKFVDGQAWSGVNASSFRIADIDADGSTDISILGLQNSTPVNFVSTFSGDSIALPTEHVITQALGDYDRDGDLDLVQLTDTLGLVLLENQTTNINIEPPATAYYASLFIYNRLFLYWTLDIDSPTPTSTYDLMLTGSHEIAYTAEFDTAGWYRQTVSHGNMSTNNFSLMKIPVADYFARVQAVDNAFLGSKIYGVLGGGICGISKEESQCPPAAQTLTACSDDQIKLIPMVPGVPVAWFSFSKGFLGIHEDSLMVESKADTLFSMSIGGDVGEYGGYCEIIRIYLIDKSGLDTIRITNDKTACEGTAVELTVADEWRDVLWKNLAEDSVGSGDTLHYVVRKEEALTALAQNDQGCMLEQTENLHISKPVLTTNGDAFRIMKGESVGLSASGANTYVWTPNESLDNGFIANPVATPAETTAYTLIGYDTLGCTDTAHVVVEIEQTAFVPNMFTPNGDGTNDQLKIYGLSNASNFRFAIHNREGNIVFETSDVTTVTSRGWDGSKQGVGQPPGLYYWKVEGTFFDGTNLQLNGRTSGSILMVR